MYVGVKYKGERKIKENRFGFQNTNACIQVPLEQNN